MVECSCSMPRSCRGVVMWIEDKVAKVCGRRILK